MSTLDTPCVERDLGAGVGVREQAGEHDAGACPGLEDRVLEVAPQDIVAGVAAVAIDVGPGAPELLAGVAGSRRAALHGEGGEQALGRAGDRRMCGGGRLVAGPSECRGRLVHRHRGSVPLARLAGGEQRERRRASDTSAARAGDPSRQDARDRRVHPIPAESIRSAISRGRGYAAGDRRWCHLARSLSLYFGTSIHT
jgi:hypothetical protein